MANPVILIVDDDPQVLRAVEHEVRGRFGGDYRIVAAGSGADALDAIRRLTLRGTPIALLVVDQRMPGMSGVELLGATLALLPGAKRVLLTAYADTDVAIRAINEIGLDQYLLKPWDPPEERLFPPSRSSWTIGAPAGSRRSRGSGWWAIAGPRGPTRSRTTSPATRSPIAGSTSKRTRKRPASSRARASTPGAIRSSSSRTGATCGPRPTYRSPRRWVCGPAQPFRSTTSSSSAEARPVSRRRSTVPPRDSGPCSWSARRRAGKPARPRGSRTTSASPPGSPGRTSPAGRLPRRPASGRRSSPRRRSSASGARTRTASSRWETEAS